MSRSQYYIIVLLVSIILFFVLGGGLHAVIVTAAAVALGSLLGGAIAILRRPVPRLAATARGAGELVACDVTPQPTRHMRPSVMVIFDEEHGRLGVAVCRRDDQAWPNQGLDTYPMLTEFDQRGAWDGKPS